MSNEQILERTWIGKDNQPKLESSFFVLNKPLDSGLMTDGMTSFARCSHTVKD